MKTLSKLVLGATLLVTTSCQLIDDLPLPGGDDNDNLAPSVKFESHSTTPSFLKVTPSFPKLQVYSMLSSEDVLPESPKFVYGSMADGAGLLKNDDGTYSLINNIEADYSIARINFDETFKPVSGEYIMNANASANTAQCSGSLITPEEHGFGPWYLSGGEWGGDSKGVYLADPRKDATDAGSAEILTASMGQWSTENAVAIGKDAFPDKTIIFIGDDNSNNEIPSGQIGMYMADRGDLYGGKLHGLKVLSEGIDFEMDMEEGKTYEAEFVELEERTLAELDAEAKAKGVMGFSRVEDIDWRRGSASNQREVYVVVTGRKKDGLVGKGTLYGRIYKIVLDKDDPKKATITPILDGDNLNGVARQFHSPDNILVTENYAYIQEDPNGYFDTADKTHFAYLYQYDLRFGTLKVVLECDQEAAAAQGYGTTDRTWEITGMIDISDTVDKDRSFVLITQNHGWEPLDGTAFTDPTAFPDLDEAQLNETRKEGSMLYVLKGLPR